MFVLQQIARNKAIFNSVRVFSANTHIPFSGIGPGISDSLQTLTFSRNLLLRRQSHSNAKKKITRKKMTAMELQHLKRINQKITMVTAYDYPSAKHVDLAGIDVLLVGDSVAMVELGYETTQPVTVDQMLHHCQAVARGASKPLLVGDMPFGSYEISAEQALENAYRFVKEGKMDAVKMEGGLLRANTVKKVVDGGIAVMGHVGLTPQAISVLGGFRAQGRTAIKARKLVDDALALQDAGAFAIVIECVPEVVGKIITESLEIPTIGIGSGKYTSGQVLVFHDMLGMMQHPHHAAFVPKFCKRYADVGGIIRQGLEAFREDVLSKNFPDENFNPYKMSKEEEQKLLDLMRTDIDERQKHKEKTAKALEDADEYETIKVY